MGRRLLRAALRRRHPFVTIGLTMWLLSSIGMAVAHADPTTPVGMGDLLPVPDFASGGAKSLFESTGYNFVTWRIDVHLGFSDVLEKVGAALVSMVWMGVMFLVFGAIGLAFWLLSFTSMTELTDVLAGAIGGTSTELLGWLMPSAIVIGAVWSWIRHKGRDALSAVTWTLLAAVFGITLATQPQVWVDGVNNARTIGADAVMSAASGAVSPDQEKPFAWPATGYGDAPGNTNAQQNNTLMRKSADAMWRGMVATPWCVLEFGSIEACQRYGPTVIKYGSDTDAREKYLQGAVKTEEGGDDSPTMRWVNGYNWPERLAIAVVMQIVVVVFAGALIILGFSALGALISAIFHLLVGVFFTLTWCIEGQPRAIGLRWLESLIGTIIQGLVALLTFSAVLVFLTVTLSQMGEWGWLPCLILAIAGPIVGLVFRKTVSQWFGFVSAGSGGKGAMLIGATIMRGMTRAGRSVAGGRGRSDLNRRAPRTGPPSPGGTGPRNRPTSTAPRRTSRTAFTSPRDGQAYASGSYGSEPAGPVTTRASTTPRRTGPGGSVVTAGPGRTGPGARTARPASTAPATGTATGGTRSARAGRTRTGSSSTGTAGTNGRGRAASTRANTPTRSTGTRRAAAPTKTAGKTAGNASRRQAAARSAQARQTPGAAAPPARRPAAVRRTRVRPANSSAPRRATPPAPADPPPAPPRGRSPRRR